MSFLAYLQEATASRSHVLLIFLVSVIAFTTILVRKSFGKQPDDDPHIPLYTPETVAVGNYKKRWSYDNPNALREAYKKVRTHWRASCLFTRATDHCVVSKYSIQDMDEPRKSTRCPSAILG